MSTYADIATANTKRAYEIIEDTQVTDIWKSIGADINLVGSLRMGLMMKHRDIDFHIYTSSISISDSFRAMSQLAQHPSIKRVEYVNLIQTQEECLEWHAWYEDKDNQLWQIDMIHILKGSRYDGYFEMVADRICTLLTPDIKDTILKLKYETPENEKIMGIEYYQAVIRDGINTYENFIQWRKRHPVTGVIEWIP